MHVRPRSSPPRETRPEPPAAAVPGTARRGLRLHRRTRHASGRCRAPPPVPTRPDRSGRGPPLRVSGRAASRPPLERVAPALSARAAPRRRSEEHTSELQSLTNLVCRLLLEKKKKTRQPRLRYNKKKYSAT